MKTTLDLSLIRHNLTELRKSIDLLAKQAEEDGLMSPHLACLLSEACGQTWKVNSTIKLAENEIFKIA